MRIRASILLLNDNKIALIKRVKPDRTYYAIPGGGVDEGEQTDEAAIREAREELGIEVGLSGLAAVVERVERCIATHLQMVYRAELKSGTFGSGIGEEFHRGDEYGHYEAVWMALDDVEKHEVYPSVLMKYLADNGAPEWTVHLKE